MYVYYVRFYIKLKCIIYCIWYDIMRDWAILHMVTLLNKLKYLDTPGQKLIGTYFK